MTETPESVEIESRIARDLAKKAAIAAPILVVGIGAWRGVDAGAAVALAFVVVVVNFLASAALLGWTARRTPELLMGVAMMSFIGRLVLITAIGVGIKALDIVDWPVFCITLVAGYLGLLFWEMRSISLSLASPGLKPRPSTHAGVDS
jgi:ATP synthase protein I